MTEPSRAQQRCMIYRPRTRQLDDGCQACGLSIPACDATYHIERVPCCETCGHRQQPERPEY